MKTSILIVLAALSVSLVSVATDGASSRLYYVRDGQRTLDFDHQVFQQITGKFQNKVQSDLAWHTNSIEVAPEGIVKAEVAGQVGREEDTRFPYPTVCMLEYHGKIKEFFRYEMGSDNKEAPFYHIDMAGPELTLIDSPKNSPRCEEYVRLNNNEKPLTWFWIDFSIEEDTLIESGRRSVFQRIR